MSMRHDRDTESSAQTPLETESREADDNVEASRGKDDTDDNLEKRIGYLRGTALGICLAILIFLQATNISMMTTVSSPIVQDLDAYSNVSWLTSSYLIAVSSITSVGGRLCKIFSSPSCLLLASILFSIGGVITAIAPTLAWFLVGRSIGGIGAGLVFGVATVFVIEMVSKERRGLFVALVNAGYTIGVASGAVIAGALEASIGWRGIFWIQIPLAIPAGLVIYFIGPKSASDRLNDGQSFATGLKRIDYLGVATMTISVVFLLYSLAAEKINYITLVTSLFVFLIFLGVEARLAKEPIVPIEVLKSRGVVLTCFATLIQMISRYTVLLWTPIYSIAVRGWSPASAGLILVPTNAGFALGGLLVGLVHIRRSQSYYLPTLLATILFCGTMLVFSKISTSHPQAALYIINTFINGFITGTILNYSYAHVLHISKPKLHPIVTSLTAMFRAFAGSFGSSIGGGIFGRVLKSNLETGFEGQDFEGKDRLISRLLGSPILARSLHGEQREVARDSYAVATSTLFLAACGLGLVAAVVQAGTGWTAADEGDDEDDEDVRPLLQSEE